MSQVTVTGRISTVLLAEGETVRVEHTDRIDRMASRGYLTIVEHHEEHTHDPLIVPQTVEDDDPVGEVGDGEPGRQIDDEPPRTGPGSHRDEWVRFLDLVGVEHDEKATRSELIAAWDGYLDES